MSAVDDLSTSIGNSEKLDPASRALLVQFLQASAPILGSLETAALQDLLQWLSGSAMPPPPAVDALDAAQVVALLNVTSAEMEGTLAQRVQQVAAARAAVAGLANTALTVLVQALVNAL
jgi:hypothetical protein